MDKRMTEGAETPRSEPEILPPLRGERAARDPRESAAFGRFSGIRIVRISGSRAILYGLLALVMAAGLMVVFAGALLIAVPVIAVLMLASFAAAWWRRTFR